MVVVSGQAAWRRGVGSAAAQAAKVWACGVRPLSRHKSMRAFRPMPAQGLAARPPAPRRNTGTMSPRPRKAAMLTRPLLVLAALLLAAAGAHAQDAAAGGMAFLQCADCHGPGTGDGVGPGLKGVVGRRAGSKAGFAYSPALAKSAVVWNDTSLDNFLADPAKAQPGTSMAFPGVADPKERADLIAYLKTLK
jgi:cytochrome c